jgi:hypothetical protein
VGLKSVHKDSQVSNSNNMDHRILFSSSTSPLSKENRGCFQVMKAHIVERPRGRVGSGRITRASSSKRSSSSVSFFNFSHAGSRLDVHGEPGLSEPDANSASLLIILLLCGTCIQVQAKICLASQSARQTGRWSYSS